MGKIATITSKGQVVIPKDIRVIYNLNPQTRVEFEPSGNHIIVKPLAQQKSKSTLGNKLSSFQIDSDFRKSWEKSLSKKIKKWEW